MSVRLTSVSEYLRIQVASSQCRPHRRGLDSASRLGWTLLMLLFPVSVVALPHVNFELFQHRWVIKIEQLIFDSLSQSSIELAI